MISKRKELISRAWSREWWWIAKHEKLLQQQDMLLALLKDARRLIPQGHAVDAGKPPDRRFCECDPDVGHAPCLQCASYEWQKRARDAIRECEDNKDVA